MLLLWRRHADGKLMGIGRLEIGKGYTLENCRPACTACIKMKGSLDARTFVERCEHIFAVAEGGAQEYPAHLFGAHHGLSYAAYRDRAARKNLEFALTKDRFDAIVAGNCYICTRASGEEHKNGVDRVDNSRGYVDDNVQTCCGQCNAMKKECTIDEFQAKAANVAQRSDELKSKLPELTRSIYAISR